MTKAMGLELADAEFRMPMLREGVGIGPVHGMVVAWHVCRYGYPILSNCISICLCMRADAMHGRMWVMVHVRVCARVGTTLVLRP